MNLEDYLASPQAVDDFRTGTGWFINTNGVWQQAWYCFYHNASVHYRREGDRYIVSDLGDGVRGLRLRTGCTASESTSMIHRVVVDGVACAEFCLEAYDPGIPLSGVAAGMLPAAVCRVLLAAYRVANYDMSGEVEE